MTDRQDNIFIEKLNTTQCEILSLLQDGLEITETPFTAIASSLGVAVSEVLATINNLFQQNILREISPVFNAASLGYASSLIAASVPEDSIESFVKYINSLPGVSHNYGRDHDFNVWFTLALPAKSDSADVFSTFLDDISHRFTLNSIISLPVLKMYKLSVHFGQKSSNHGNPCPAVHRKPVQYGRPDIIELDEKIILALQNGIPVCERPFAEIADIVNDDYGSKVNLSESDILDKLLKWQQHGVIRRIAGRVHHYKMGYSANAMVVFSMKPEYISAAAASLVKNDFISHCYHRQRNELWQYDLYAMVHSSSEIELKKSIDLMLGQVSEYESYAVLRTTSEYKKQSVRYYA